MSGRDARLVRGRSLDDAPVEIDGMHVLFDKRVALFPVTLVEPPAKAPAERPATHAGREGHGQLG